MRPRTIPRLLKNRFGHVRAGWRIALYIVFLLGLNKALSVLGNSLLLGGETPGDYYLLVNRFIGKSLQFLVVLVPGLVLLQWLDRRPLALLGLGGGRGVLKKLLLGMGMGFLLIALGGLLLGLTGLASFSFNGLSVDMLFYLLCGLVVLAVSACYEEVLFRGYIFQSLIEGTSFWIALGIFALLFGAAHVSNPGATIPSVAFAVAAGVLLGTIYYQTRTLWMCIGVHFMWNWTTGAILGMGIKDSKFARRSLFTYIPSDSSFIVGADAMNEIILGILVVALTICLLKTRWLKPSEYHQKLWAKYPPRFGVEPELSGR